MARSLRLEFPGALYHVTSRGNERRCTFRSDRDRKAFLGFLGTAVKRFGWSLTAYVLMSNHYHLVIQTSEPNLSRGMQWLNGRYAAWFNAVHRRSGHLFQGRFHSFLIEKETYFEEVLRYVALNPVRAGMCELPEDYKWSSYRATVGLDSQPDWLDVRSALSSFGGGRGLSAEESFRSFVVARLSSKESIWKSVSNAIYLGSPDWAKRMRLLVESRLRSTDHPKKQRAVGRPSVEEILASVARITAKTVEAVRQGRAVSERRMVAWLAWNEGLVTLRSIAAALRLRSEGYVCNLVRRFGAEVGADPSLLASFDAVVADLRA